MGTFESVKSGSNFFLRIPKTLFLFTEMNNERRCSVAILQKWCRELNLQKSKFWKESSWISKTKIRKSISKKTDQTTNPDVGLTQNDGRSVLLWLWDDENGMDGVLHLWLIGMKMGTKVGEEIKLKLETPHRQVLAMTHESLKRLEWEIKRGFGLRLGLKPGSVEWGWRRNYKALFGTCEKGGKKGK